MSNQRIVIHIGYPKCASSWLQQVMFADEQTGFLAAWGAKSKEVKKQFVNSDNSSFNADEVRRVYNIGLQAANQNNLVPVLSNEHLSGNLANIGWKQEVADRLYSTFPEAKIIIIVREQKSILLSAYGQCIKLGRTLTIEEFLGSIQKGHETADNLKRPTFKLDFVKYDLLIEYYQNVFSKENVLVLPFELLKKDSKKFAQAILDFSGSNGSLPKDKVAKNSGYRGGSLIIKRRLNILFPLYNRMGIQVTGKLSAAADKMIPSSFHERIENRWKQYIEQRVGNYFHLSNQRTSRLIGINLADFGYDC
ncbi:MAG: sulfotransferase domain-containing protein [Coleofasciculus sp. B1-GNL1-01]|uniref:sulfotransferase domain-containing protein n=1 Tax=Coleofasciculus sp. B1-GNL1-01 TaxID=3068484 RepID=UPI0032FB0A4E